MPLCDSRPPMGRALIGETTPQFVYPKGILCCGVNVKDFDFRI